LGILDYMVRAFDPAGERDLVFRPVGINYDRTFEDRSLLHQRDPGAPRKSATAPVGTTTRFVGRNLWLRATNRWHRFGYACVNFGSPVSLRLYVDRRGVCFRDVSLQDCI